MGEAVSLRIKNWKKFQHFKDRTPPWVKLYRDILEDPDWHELDGDCAKTMVMLWLIASEDEHHNGTLPDTRKLAFRLRISENKLNQQLTKLSNWLEQDDITVISGRYQVDAPERAPEETETETETETERETPFAPTRQAKSKPKEEFVRFVNGSEDPTGHFDVAKEIRLQWLSAYPAVQVGTELEKAAAWVMANPAKRKKDWRRFLNNWMMRAQERAR